MRRLRPDGDIIEGERNKDELKVDDCHAGRCKLDEKLGPDRSHFARRLCLQYLLTQRFVFFKRISPLFFLEGVR